MRLASALGLSIKYWLPTPLTDSPFSLALQTSTLLPLLSHRTRLVAFTATSNLLGHFTDVKEAVRLVKEKTGGRGITVVDCVAYAPHGRIDMKDWGCDAVLFSYYKVSFTD
jgi:selenocysteine lyase/cysteine desulfurase